jgi:predicted short-subunit dehydrogenase-like oxidoreductase (DUF2520 family)
MNWCSKLPTRYPNMVTRYGISLIGAGRLARSLGFRLRESGWRIHSVVARSEASARRAVRSIGAGQAKARLSQAVFLAPVLLVAVPDSAIHEIALQLAEFGGDALAGRVVLHTSGALSSEALAPVRLRGAAAGSVHPLQTFSGIGIPSLEGRMFAVEGEAAAVRVARAMVRALGGQTLLLDSSVKSLYHAAASMAAGQVLAQLEAAVQLLVAIGLKRREALNALLPLTRQVLDNLETVGPRAAWTGSLARGDHNVIAAHEAALRSLPEEYLGAYRALNRLALRVLSGDSRTGRDAASGVPAPSVTHKAKGVSA